MQEELDQVIELTRKEVSNWREPVRVRHSEPGVMYTLAFGKDQYKVIKVNDEWKITPLK